MMMSSQAMLLIYCGILLTQACIINADAGAEEETSLVPLCVSKTTTQVNSHITTIIYDL